MNGACFEPIRMDRLRRLEIFVSVADAGSFARAAEALLVTPSAVSHAIAQLERELGMSLVYRTTRQLRLSPDGALVLRHAREMLAGAARLDAMAGGQRERIAGTLRIGIPPGVAMHLLMPLLTGFRDRHPEVNVEMRARGGVAEINAGGLDAGIQFGPLADSELVARPLGRLKFGVYASPGYLGRHGTPRHPRELLAHRTLIHKSPLSTTISPWDRWDYERGDDRGTVEVGRHLVTDDREALLSAAVADAGLFRIGFFSPALLHGGRLVRVLGDWSWPGGPALSLLYRRSSRLPRRVSVFIDFVADAISRFDPDGETFEADPALRAIPRTRGGAH
jgi:DNA-binding transcriptional LysR family regulator